MYMLEGVSKWNLNQAAQALSLTETSRTKIYDIHLMSNVNVLSNKVLGRPLLPEFIPPGKPTGKKKRLLLMMINLSYDMVGK